MAPTEKHSGCYFTLLQVLMKWAGENNVKGDLASLCKDSRVAEKVLGQMNSVGKVRHQ